MSDNFKHWLMLALILLLCLLLSRDTKEALPAESQPLVTSTRAKSEGSRDRVSVRHSRSSKNKPKRNADYRKTFCAVQWYPSRRLKH